MASSRMVREFQVAFDPWPIVERWATSHHYRSREQGLQRLYRKGSGIAVGARALLVGVAGDRVHLEAWVSANGLARAMSLFMLPKEITIEPGGMKAALPRKIGRSEVDDLLADLGQPSVERGGGSGGYTPPGFQLPSQVTPPPMPGTQPGTHLPAAPPSQMATAVQTAPWSPPMDRAEVRGRRLKRWRVVLGLSGLVILTAVVVTKAVSSTPSLQELNAGAGPGANYSGPGELYRAVTAGEVAAGSFRRGDDQTIPSAMGTVLVSKSGDFTVGGAPVTVQVYAPGGLMEEYRDSFVKIHTRTAAKYGTLTWVLVGPNWTIDAEDSGVLADIQEAIGGQLHG